MTLLLVQSLIFSFLSFAALAVWSFRILSLIKLLLEILHFFPPGDGILGVLTSNSERWMGEGGWIKPHSPVFPIPQLFLIPQCRCPAKWWGCGSLKVGAQEPEGGGMGTWMPRALTGSTCTSRGTFLTGHLFLIGTKAPYRLVVALPLSQSSLLLPLEPTPGIVWSGLRTLIDTEGRWGLRAGRTGA